MTESQTLGSKPFPCPLCGSEVADGGHSFGLSNRGHKDIIYFFCLSCFRDKDRVMAFLKERQQPAKKRGRKPRPTPFTCPRCSTTVILPPSQASKRKFCHNSCKFSASTKRPLICIAPSCGKDTLPGGRGFCAAHYIKDLRRKHKEQISINAP